MNGTNPKVSFIPKGSLVREESFLERKRPRSVIGFLAIFTFLASAASYIGLYMYNASLAKSIVAKTDEIKSAQREFSSAPQVEQAKVFRSRAALARELLDAHTVASPVLAFISQNTVGSIVYDQFSLEQKAGGATLELSGEAPTYAALAYQGDVLRKKTKELTSVSIHNVSLTSFGTVSFALTMSFAPDFLSYTKNIATVSPIGGVQTLPPQGAQLPGVNVTATSSKGRVNVPPLASSTLPTIELPPLSTTTPAVVPGVAVDSRQNVIPPQVSPVNVQATTTQPPSFWSSLWGRIKFW